MASDKPPAFQFYPKDFLSDDAVALMTNEQIGCYVLLLSHAWLNPGGLPPAMSSLAKLARCTPARFERCVWDGIRDCFQQDGSGRWFNQKIERVRAEQQAFRAERSESGKQGAEARWGKAQPSKLNGSAIGEPLAKHSSASASASATAEDSPQPPAARGARSRRVSKRTVMARGPVDGPCPICGIGDTGRCGDVSACLRRERAAKVSA